MIPCPFLFIGDERRSESGDETDDTELDQQMGDVGEEECDKLDEQMWGSDDDEDLDEQPQVVLRL